MRIGIAGINGRVGGLLVDEIRRRGDTLSGGLDRPGSGRPTPAVDITLYGSIDALAGASDVVVDFTVPATVPAHAIALSRHRAAWVLGTTGIDAAAQREVAQAAQHVPVVQAANFSAGVTLVLELAARMAAVLPPEEYDAEIVEMHHRQKLDAPSGTALAIGEAVAAARGTSLAAVRDSGRDGITGARTTGAVGFASLRGGQIVGEHALLFTGSDEQIGLTHRAFDRRAFAAGAIRAAHWSGGKAAGLYGMRDVLGLS
nr:4-hydroxy-tetrahydrodipicolinate reductase [uncultured Lichenicoccus sp.]